MSVIPDGASQYLDHGFVKLVDVFGTDQDIEEAARVSYSGGDETRKVSDTRNLLRYLMNHRHTSPFEMAEVKFVLRVPIFVMRQLVRHRTANLNEYSGRYSEMTSDCYVPDLSRIQKQSTTNKQGSGEAFTPEDQDSIRNLIISSQASSVADYQSLMEQGFAKELARGVLPVSNYTELYWKCDLNNLFHFMHLRLDPHAQWEIVKLAQLMYDMVYPKFPLSMEAFDDYIMGSVKFSRMEMDVLRNFIQWVNTVSDHSVIAQLISVIDDEAPLSKREKDEFKKKLALI